MKTLSISKVSKRPGILKAEVEKGPVRIVWKEPKPNGKVILSAIITKEEQRMDLNIIGKGETFELSVMSKQVSEKKFYFGAGWDNPNGPVDLDIVCVALTDNKLAKKQDLIYFNNQNAPGIALSEDNQTGDGEGDDESIVIDTSKLDPIIDKIVIGLAAYAGADLNSAPNTHFRVCDGDKEESAQIGDVTVGNAEPGDTVLVAFTLVKTSNGWVLENNGDFHKKGQGNAAIEGFGSLFM